MECVQVGQLKGHTESVKALALLPDGRLASGSWDETIRIWDIASQQCVGTLQGPISCVISLAVLANGRLASSSWDNNTIKIWNTDTLEYVGTLPARGGGESALIRARRSRGESWKVILAALPDGTLASTHGSVINIWDISTRECVTQLEGHDSDVRSLCVLPTGQLVSGSDDSTIRIWSVSIKRCDTVLQGHTDAVMALCVLPTGHLASGSEDMTIRTWNLSGRRCEFTLQGHTNSVCGMACLESGHLVSGGEDESTRIWDTDARECKVTLRVKGGSVFSLLSLPDGIFASGNRDGTIRLWKFPRDQLAISDVVSSPLFASYAKLGVSKDPGRSFKKRVVNIWYNMNGAASWVHNLRGHYVQQCGLNHVLRVNSSPSAVDFDKYFVNLALIRHVDHITREKGLVTGKYVAAMSLDRGELYDRLFMERRYCAVESIFGDLEDRNQSVGWIKIIGRAGTGKTTLTHFLAFRWGMKASLWDNRFDVVFRVKLNLVTQDGVFEPGGSGITDLVALIFASLDRLEVFDRNTIRYFLERRPLVILLLLDGFDEIAGLYGSNIRVKGLVDHAFSLPNGILTSRPLPFPPDWSTKAVFKQAYENIGLSEQNVVSYVEQYYAVNNTVAKGSLLETLQRNPNLMRLAQIPVNLNAMCNIWQEKSKQDQKMDRIATMTGVYDRMVLGVLRHAKLKKSPDATKYELSDNFLRKENSVWLCELSRLAYVAFEADQTQTIGPDLLSKYLGECTGDSVKLLNVFRVEWGLIREAEAAPNPSSSGLSAHYFVHLTYQEYFVALYFVDALLEQNELGSARRDYLKRIQTLATKIRDNLQNPRYEVIWIFVAGLLSRSPYVEYADYFWDALLPCEDNGIGHSCSLNSSSSSSSTLNKAGFLGMHPTSSTVSTYGRLIRESVFGQEKGQALPRRLEIVQDRFRLVLQWQLLCEDRGLTALGDPLTDSDNELRWKLQLYESRRRQLLYDLDQLGVSALNSTPWSLLRGFAVLNEAPPAELPVEPVVLSHLASKSKWTRVEAVGQLYRQSRPDSVGTLFQLSESDEDLSVRAMALISWCLQEDAVNNGPQRAVTTKLDGILKTTSCSEIKRSAVLLIGTRCMKLPPEEQSETLVKLRSIMKQQDENSQVILTCAKLLALVDNDPEALHQIIEALKDIDSKVRIEALLYLAENACRLVDKDIVTHFLTSVQEVPFIAWEQDLVATALRRIRPEMYASVDKALFSHDVVARGFIESLWIQMGVPTCSTPELRQIEDKLIAEMSHNNADELIAAISHNNTEKLRYAWGQNIDGDESLYSWSHGSDESIYSWSQDSDKDEIATVSHQNAGLGTELGAIIQALREPLTLPLTTRVFEDSFVSDTLKSKVLLDDLCIGNMNLGTTSVLGLKHCCDSVQGVLTLERALFGPGPCLTCDMYVPGVSVNDVRQAVVDCGTFLDATIAAIPELTKADRNHLLTIRLYTLVTPPIFKLLNFPFYNPDNRNANSVLNQLPYMKYLLHSYDAVCSSADQLIYTGPAFRGVSITISELLERKYRNWQTEYIVGNKLTFPSFTSVSLDMTIAEKFAGKGERIIFKFSMVTGLRLENLSAIVEQEVLLRPPAVFTIKAVAMEVNKTLSLTLEMDLSSPLTYL
jgi:WD40 repeat protein